MLLQHSIVSACKIKKKRNYFLNAVIKTRLKYFANE